MMPSAGCSFAITVKRNPKFAHQITNNYIDSNNDEISSRLISHLGKIKSTSNSQYI
jgi:hypothetical protein